MSNKRGFEIIDGKMYLDGVEIEVGGGGGSTPVHNKFNKICVYGTSIEDYPSGMTSWVQHMADALGMTHYMPTGNLNPSSGVYHAARGGASITWWDYDKNIDAYKDIQDIGIYIGGSISATKEERKAAINACAAFGYDGEGDNAKTIVGGFTRNDVNKMNADYPLSPYLYNSFEHSVLEQDNVDLYIFATPGINDRHTWMHWGTPQQTSFTLHNDLNFDRRTIYGAYNYILRELYKQNQNAKVVILGQHTFQWENQDAVNGIQRAVAETWQIPFADWGHHLSLDESYRKSTPVTVGGIGKIKFLDDQVHPNAIGAELLGKWVAKWIVETELTSLNPRFININES